MRKENRRLQLLSFFCCLAYFASYTTRINYTAVRLAIADELALTRPELVLELGLAISAASLSYGFGQFVSGVVGILNAITYIGGALSPHAVALVASEYGWNAAVLLWAILAALSVVLCAAACRKWNAFRASL